jgi:hypothetical protein
MVMQFKEHENGQKSSDPKMAKLDKLARLLNVKIHVDGIAYGKISDDDEVISLPEEELSQIKTEEAPKPKRAPSKTKKVVDKSE